MDNSFDRLSRGLATTTSRRQALRMLGGGLVGGALAGAGLSIARDAAAKPDRGSNPLVFGYEDAPLIDDARTFTGSAIITELADAGDGTLLASGTVTGLLSDDTEINEGFTGPLALSRGETASSLQGIDAFAPQSSKLAQQGGGSCSILYLTLGPIHLDLLGLVIDTNEIVIDIHADPGPGNLLGNLLCAVAGLLDNGGGGLQGLLSQINQILSQLLGGL